MTARKQHGANYNLRVGRHPATVVHEVATLMRQHDLDFLAGSEAPGYVKALKRATRKGGQLAGFKVIGYPNLGEAARETVIVVRKTPKGPGGWNRRLHWISGGWEKGKGRKGQHVGRKYVSAHIGGIGFRLLAVHTAPGPFGKRFPLRRRANLSAFTQQTKLCKRWSAGKWNRCKRWLEVGDWNRHASDPEVKAHAKAVGGTIHGDGIDFVISHGLKVSNVRRVKFGGSDHDPVLFDVEKP